MCLNLCPLDLAVRLLAARLARGLTYTTCARQLGVEPSEWAAWERRFRRPAPAMRRRLERWIKRVR